MSELSIQSLTATLRSAVTTFLRLVRGLTFDALRKAPSYQGKTASAQLDLRVLNCRVRLTRQKENNCESDVFTVGICGSIHAPSSADHAAIRISITDITDGIAKARPVHSHLKQWQTERPPIFRYEADLGRIVGKGTTMPDWIRVAQIHPNELTLPHKGKRNLLFDISILSRDSGRELTRAKCTFSYENPAFGYIDLQENIQRAKTLAVVLAFAISAVDDKLYDCEIELIKKWARDNIDASRASNRARRKLEKALDTTVEFLRDGNQLDSYKICEEIVRIAPVGERYDILDLCMRVAQANGVATAEEVALLKRFASWLEVDVNRFRTMMEKILPVNMHEVADAEVILGVTSDMGKEQTRQHLNREYRKWNARVTSDDPEIQDQADYMLKFIAEAKSEYIV